MSVLVSLLHSLPFLPFTRVPPPGDLALGHQLTVVHRSRRPRLPLTVDRMLWATLVAGMASLAHGASRGEAGHRHHTWHRRGFRLFWTWKSRRRTERPSVAKDVRVLVRELTSQNPLWGCPAARCRHYLSVEVVLAPARSGLGDADRKQPGPGGIDMDAALANAAGDQPARPALGRCGTEDTLFNANRAFSTQLSERGVEHCSA